MNFHSISCLSFGEVFTNTPITIDTSSNVYIFSTVTSPSSLGLWKYDGQNWQKNDYLFTNNIGTIEFSPNHQLWLGGHNSLMVFEHDSLIANYDSLLPSNSSVYHIEFETDSILWLAISNNQGKRIYEFNVASGTITSDSIFDAYTSINTFHVLDTTIFFSNQTNSNLPNYGLYEKIGDTIHLLSTLYSPWFISDDSLGRLWFQGAASSSNLEIIQSDGSLSFQPFTVDNLSKEPFNRVSYSIYIDEEEQIWVGSTHGVHVMAQTNSWITYDPYSSQIPLYGNTSISGGIGLLSFIKNDSKNNIWIGRNEGLAVYKDGVWNSIELNGLFRNDGTFIIFDQQDNGWYLSEVDGSGNMVSQIIRVGIEETKSWDLTSSPASIPDIKTLGVLNDSTLILASTIDGQGGYVGSGIVKATFLANDSIEFDTTLLYLDATNDTPLIDIEVVNPSSLWYSNRNGLFIFNPLDSTIETVYSFVQNLIGDSTLQITYDPTNQIIWAHNYYCVFKFDSTGLLAKFDLPHQGNDYVTTLALDPDGIPWIMFPGDPINLSGALFFQLVKVLPDSSFLITTHEDLKIPEEGIEPNGFAIDDEGLIWIGLNTGVINFDPKAGPSFSIKNFSLCVGDTGRFNNYSPPADSFHWQVDGGFVTSDSNLTYTFLDPGTHEVSLIAFNDSLAESFSQFIFVKPSPVVEFPKDDTVACSERVYMNIGRNDLSYAWFDLQENLLASSPGFIIDSSGIYILEGTDGCGQFDRDTISVTLTTIPDSSCVWPGDVDANGWVNIYDFLILGTLIGDTGLSRPNAINDFISQPSPDWSETIIHGLVRPGINKKHADCNGDGVINEADMAIVFANAQGAFPQQVTAASSTLELRVVPREKTIQVGDTIHYDVYLYDLENGIVQNAYGLAFTIENNLLVSSPPILDKMNSWLGIPGDLEHGYIKYGLSTDIGLTLKTKMPKSDSANVHQFCSLLKAEDIDTSKWVNQIYFTTQTNNSVMVEVDGTEQSISALNAATLETVTVNIPWVDLEINVLLQGAMDEGLKMRTSLRDSNWLPKRHPYGTIYQAKPDSIPLEIVDWVLVELRDAQDPTQIISQRAAWVDSTGLIVDPEGGNGLGIQAKEGAYYIVVKHRNHLPIMSASPVYLFNDGLNAYNFMESPTSTFGTNAQLEVSPGVYAMWAGDANQDGVITYSGSTNDRETILQLVGQVDPTLVFHPIDHYHPADLNLDGKVQYSGPDNDRAIILRTLGGDNPLGSKESAIP